MNIYCLCLSAFVAILSGSSGLGNKKRGVMSIIDKLRPAFWNYEDVAAGTRQEIFSFRRKWWRTVILTTIVALAPLIILSIFDYRMTKIDMKTAAIFDTSRMVSNTWRSVSFFLSERQSVMTFILKDNTEEELLETGRLDTVLKNLKAGVGGFADLGVVSSRGRMLSYAGPYGLKDRDLCEEACFKEVIKRGFYVGDLIQHRRPNQHLIMAVRKGETPKNYFVLRATLDIKPFESLLADLDTGPKGDAFIINHAGILQTPSRFYGQPHEEISLRVPDFSTKPRVIETKDRKGTSLVVGYAGIPDTSLMMMIVRDEKELMEGWRQSRVKMIVFLGISVAAILLMVLGMATYLVNRIHAADQRRIMELHRVEYANKMASLGRLSAGVGHEINNPIAIINEKIGLIEDLLLQNEANPFNEKMLGLATDVIDSIKRCGDITHRLINFGRYQDIRLERLDLRNILYDLVAFMEKEAEYLCIDINIHVPENFPVIESDKNSLQQIFLNIISNAFAAMEDGGRLDITAENEADGSISITFADTGRGIASEDLKRVFEPFFSSDSSAGGTGLGLSVTYGLVTQIGGHISVDSEKNKGTRFIVDLPLKTQTENQKDD